MPSGDPPEIKPPQNADAPPDTDAPLQDDAAFPGPGALCEECGYRLHGLTEEGDCPECGTPVRESSPDQRTGLSWQNTPTPRAWFATAWAMFAQPKRGFRALRAGGSNWQDRVFLAVIAVLITAYWVAVWHAGRPLVRNPWVWGVSAGVLMVVLTYIEALGVAYFARRRGWRVPVRLAERICCYSAVGWLPAAVLLIKAWLLKAYYVDDAPWWLNLQTKSAYSLDVVVFIALGAAASLWFETLTWLGVRVCKHANSGAASQ